MRRKLAFSMMPVVVVFLSVGCAKKTAAPVVERQGMMDHPDPSGGKPVEEPATDGRPRVKSTGIVLTADLLKGVRAQTPPLFEDGVWDTYQYNIAPDGTGQWFKWAAADVSRIYVDPTQYATSKFTFELGKRVEPEGYYEITYRYASGNVEYNLIGIFDNQDPYPPRYLYEGDLDAVGPGGGTSPDMRPTQLIKTRYYFFIP